jgi:hypothetical protein
MYVDETREYQTFFEINLGQRGGAIASSSLAQRGNASIFDHQLDWHKLRPNAPQIC